MGVKFISSSELVDNYKVMDLASAENKMIALCDEYGKRLLSIGDDGVLYLIYEEEKKEAGWEKLDLSSSLTNLFSGKVIRVKNFQAIKNNDKYIIAAVITANNKDTLFISIEDDIKNPIWNIVPFDYDGKNGDNISSVYICSFNNKLSIICDVLEESRLIKRYFIDYENILKQNKKWIKHPLPADFEITNVSCMGKIKKEYVDGIYTLGKISNKQQLIYTPVYNAFDVSVMPTPIRLNLPKNVDAITCSTLEIKNNKKYTNLFACGSGSLYLFPYDKQKDGNGPIEIAVNDKLKDVTNLYAYEINNLLMVWGSNQNGKVFYCFCKKDSLEDKNSWSEVLTFMDKIEYFYPYINEVSNSNNILAYGRDKTLIIGEQSPNNTFWNYFNVTLPSLDGKSMKFTSYTTKITVTDENNNILKNKKLYLQASDYCSAYINGFYYYLKENPIEVETNEYGIIKIIYKTDSPVSKDFKIYTSDGEEENISPWDKSVDRLLELQEPEKIKNAVIVDNKGNTTPLVDSNVSDDALNAVAQSMEILAQSKESLNTTSSLLKLTNPINKKNNFNGITICVNNNNIKSYTGQDSILKAIDLNMVMLNSKGSVSLKNNTVKAYNTSGISTIKGGIIDDIVYCAADVINFIKDLGEKIYNITINYIEDAWNFIVSVGKKIYSFVIDCAEALISGIEVVWNLIGVAIEKIVEFIKFVFDWDDILKTKDVMKKLFNLGMDKLTDSVEKSKVFVDDIIDEVTKKIDIWADITHIDEFDNKTIEEISSENKAADITNVTDSYLLDHFTDNYENMEFETTIINNAMTVEAKENAIAKSNEDYFSIFEEYAKTQGKIIEDLIKQIETEFIDNDISKLDFLTVVKKVVAILTDTMLYSMQNGINIFIDLFSSLIDIVKESLNYEIRIPVLSDILEDIFGIKPFSFLDVISLISSVLVNASYKLLTQEKLFDDDTYNYIMNSNSIDELLNDNSKKMIENVNILDVVDTIQVQGIKTTKVRKNICIICHMASGTFRIMETVVHPITIIVDETGSNPISKKVDYIDLGFIFGAAVLSFTADMAYKPYDTIQGMIAVPIISKYIPLACRIANKAAGKLFKTSAIASESFGMCADGIYTMGCFMDLIIDGIYLVTTCIDKKGDELGLGIVELISKIMDNIGSMLDIATKYIKEPDTVIVLEVIREGAILAYSGLQISEGLTINSCNIV